MSTDSFIITKRDGSTEAFSVEKIKSAILKAFTSVNEPLDNDGLQKIVGQLKFCNGMSVEDIQNQVEVALMSLKHFKAAKEFMIYRKRHEDDRETADKLRFLIDYCNAANPATGSKFDSNANVENKNIATLIGELPKQGFIRLTAAYSATRSRACMAKRRPTAIYICSTTTISIRTTRRALPIIAPPSPCIRGFWRERRASAATPRSRPT